MCGTEIAIRPRRDRVVGTPTRQNSVVPYATQWFVSLSVLRMPVPAASKTFDARHSCASSMTNALTV